MKKKQNKKFHSFQEEESFRVEKGKRKKVGENFIDFPFFIWCLNLKKSVCNFVVIACGLKVAVWLNVEKVQLAGKLNGGKFTR